LLLQGDAHFHESIEQEQELSGGYFTSPWVEQNHEPDLAVTLALMRYFGGD
jgi:hypothetical protein